MAAGQPYWNFCRREYLEQYKSQLASVEFVCNTLLTYLIILEIFTQIYYNRNSQWLPVSHCEWDQLQNLLDSSHNRSS